MAFDDRDQNFEKALARHVRANAASAADCPDAETLAAYYDRLLSQDEMIAKKSHIAGCARCQEILSSLEATDAIPVGMEEQENVVTFAAPRAAAAAGPDASFGRADRMSMPASAPAKSSVREIPRRPFYMRWVAPAGAIAAGLLVWISVHEWSANKRATTSVVQVAQNREEKLPELPASKAAEPQVSPALRSEAKTALKEETATVKKADAGDLLGERSEEGRAKLSAPKRPDHGPKFSQNSQNQMQNPAQNQAAGDYKYQAPAARQQVEVQALNVPQKTEQAAVNGAAAAPAPPALADKETSKDASTANSDSLKTVPMIAGGLAKQKKVADADAATSVTELTSSYESNERMLLRDSKLRDGAFIKTPDPRVFWLLVSGGRLYKTQDAGATLKQQKSGVHTEILAGSAPDFKVCWLVGRSGVILRTTDGGEHWTKIKPPASADFTAIEATDALHAIISGAAAQTRFSTSDGGVSWTALPKE